MALQVFRYQLHLARRIIKRLRFITCLLILTVLSIGSMPRVAHAQAVPAVLPPTFSVQRGFYTNPFPVTLSTATAGATIRYTTDGTTPSQTVGTVYSGPLNIAATIPLRAIAYTGSATSIVVTHTY